METHYALIIVVVMSLCETETAAQRQRVRNRQERQVTFGGARFPQADFRYSENGFPFRPFQQGNNNNQRFPSNFIRPPVRPDGNNLPAWTTERPPALVTRPSRQNPHGGRGPLQFPGNGDDDDRLVFDPPTSSRPTRQTTRTTTSRSQPVDNCIANCQTTAEFNPVCGTDEVTYTNPGRLKCATMCGRGVSLGHYGSCVPTSTQAASTARSRQRS